MAPQLSIAEMHGLPSTTTNRFRIVEKVVTIDGPRDRFTNESFKTLDEAFAFVTKALNSKWPLGGDDYAKGDARERLNQGVAGGAGLGHCLWLC